jgi:hypothetical protein
MGLSHPDSDTFSPLLTSHRFTLLPIGRSAKTKGIVANNRVLVNFSGIQNVKLIAGTGLDSTSPSRIVFFRRDIS